LAAPHGQNLNEKNRSLVVTAFGNSKEIRGGRHLFSGIQVSWGLLVSPPKKVSQTPPPWTLTKKAPSVWGGTMCPWLT